ncbi:MAG TPA: hypothetical protein VLI67_06870 [Vicinamibacteria bacterium]|nr:hypothetical protein [Vicinamibacteria bacterium]
MVFRNVSGESLERVLVARWMTGVFGLRWIDDLVKARKAVDLGGNGYPCRYSIAAGVLRPVISNGLPPNESPPVIGADYALPGGWSSELKVDAAALSECRSEEELLIEAWDQS